MTLANTFLALSVIAACVAVAVHSHPTGLAIERRDISSNETFPRYSRCYSKLNQRQKAELESKNGVIGDKYRWPGGVMYYTYDNSVTRSNRRTIEKGMKLITDRTCFTFEPRTNQRNYVLIKTNDPDGGCFSTGVGMTGRQQTVNLDQNGCMSAPTAAHELIHALGFVHEQERNDRDDYIRVIWDNIQKQYWDQFDNTARIETYGVRYNVRSIMHYEAYSTFGIDINKPIMVSKNKNDPIPATQDEQLDLTDTDAEKINAMYANECTF